MEPVIPKKRPLDDAIQCKLEEHKKHRTFMQAVRDFPPGCGFNEAKMMPSKNSTKIHSNLGKIVDNKPDETDIFNNSKPQDLKRNKTSVVSKPVGKVKPWNPPVGYNQKPKVTTTYKIQKKNVDPNIRKLTLKSEDDILMNPQPIENSKVKSFEPNETLRNKSYLGSRSTGKVKFYDPMREPKKLQEPEVTSDIVSQKEQIQRKKIQEAKAMFDKIFEELSQKNRLNHKIAPCNVPLEVAKSVKKKLKWIDPRKSLGHVCGVQVGDMFKYRPQLVMFGLHCQPLAGIDYEKIEGKNLAISIVDAHRYSNESLNSDTLIYCGQGGFPLFGPKSPPEDQTLEKGGNRALKNSMDKKSVVRVIRKIKWFKEDMFVYDGLYNVKDCTKGKSDEGKIVFKFHLSRVPGQPSLQQMLNGS